VKPLVQTPVPPTNNNNNKIKIKENTGILPNLKKKAHV
jgi:hypothetical protein